ncbi:hypothetical protein [Rufibacter hautae]|uniref:Entericidin n=1 Tax=Rufibacter hautae TaxID=2595005 RepID=A0A5B6TL35_9BACT|nr:hypothetical protein [Rufibacter hautae]KAA3440105.1 hypothetical protein FOA19_05410 [Rufibacter hautae]
MKSIMPFFAACALLAGSACSTYTSSTDPIDLGSGTTTEEVTASAPVKEEAHTVAAPVKTDSAAVAQPDSAAHSEEAAH